MPVVALVSLQVIVVRADVDLDLVVESTAASVVELLQDVPGRVAVVLAVLGVRSNMVNDTNLDSPIFEPVVGTVVETAEAEGFLGAVLYKSV